MQILSSSSLHVANNKIASHQSADHVLRSKILIKISKRKIHMWQ
jgi:hypothetical protein